MVHAIILDWGGVIQRTLDQGPRQALETEMGLAAGTLERAVFHHPDFDRASLGQCAADTAWDAVVTSLGWSVQRVDEFVERFFAGDRLDQTLLNLVSFWRCQGLKVGLLSNAPGMRRNVAPSFAAKWGVDGLFDAQVFSYQVGIWKPDPRMYHTILAALGISAQESIFVDDMQENVDAALALGMDAVRFVGLVPLLRDLAARGIPLPPHASH